MPHTKNNKRKIIIFSILFALFVLFCITNSDINIFSPFSNKLEKIQIGDRTFKVISELSDKEMAAKILNDVDKNIKLLQNHINDKYSEDKILNNANYKIYKQIRDNFNKTYFSESLIENYPKKRKIDVSYNYDKGKTIALCLRDYDTKYFHQFNDIMFVALHELAHSLNYSYDHDESFWGIFKLLLIASSEINIYNDTKYSENNVNYCSMNITYNPVHDKSLYSYY